MFILCAVEAAEWGPDYHTPLLAIADRDRATAEMERLTRQDATAAALVSARRYAMIKWRHANPRPALGLSKPIFDQRRQGDKAYQKLHVQACQTVRGQQEAFERSPVVLAWKAAETAAEEAAQQIQDVPEEEILEEMARYERYCLTEVQVL